VGEHLCAQTITINAHTCQSPAIDSLVRFP
jgi:hypothetical protein